VDGVAPLLLQLPVAGVEPTITRPGGVSYLRIPAADPHRSAEFDAAVDPAGNIVGAWQMGPRQ
jgi:hypothetical protein